ncbi:MAG: ARMT1-like domain-containing protein [Methanospirillum sp.]|nr:ARMT1-like domain-containing protein [Methanospirillum sp.]
MEHDQRCHDCLLSRVSLEIELGKKKDRINQDILKHADLLIRFLHTTPWTHPMVASALHRWVYRELGVSDPFYALKETSRIDSLRVLKTVSDTLAGFRERVLASIIGNMFDYGVKGHEVSDDFLSFFRKEYASGLAIDDTREILPLCQDVLYFTDNCGEIVFDRFLISWLKENNCRVTVVLRDKPILNDATLEDAYNLGLDTLADNVLSSGSGVEIGVRFDLLSEEVLTAMDRCSLIISKGMANYESLREEEGLPPVAYLLAAKCDPIAEEFGVRRGDKIASLRRPR